MFSTFVNIAQYSLDVSNNIDDISGLECYIYLYI